MQMQVRRDGCSRR